jgi:hypothetical protein
LGVAQQVLRSLRMESIDPQVLTSVRGGFGALLGLLQAAPGILQGVTGLIGALKGSGGTATASAQPQPQPTMATPPSAAPAAAAPTTQMASSGPPGGACRCCCDPIGASSVTNIIRIG